MLKTLLLVLVPATGLCQSKHLGSYYELRGAPNGKNHELTMYKADSFYYKIQGIMELKGKYRVNYDSLILATGSRIPIIFQIKNDRLVSFNVYSEKQGWYLIKVK